MEEGPLKIIWEALKVAETKKEKLKKAFEELEAQSPLLSSFPLNWSDLDSHFASSHASLTRRFRRLHSLPPAVPARPELKAFCEKMDGKGLRRYVGELFSQRAQIKDELPHAIRSAPDPPALVLDAVDDLYARLDGAELGFMSRVCEVLLDTLMAMRLTCSPQVTDRAKKLAFHWKLNVDKNHLSLSTALLLLIAAYQLVSYFHTDDLLHYLVIISTRHRQTSDLIRSFDLLNKVPDLIQKLISKGKQLLAVKFAFEFNLTDKFAPIPLLKTYIEGTKKATKKLCVEGNNSLKSLNEATDKETSALRSVIKIIEEHKLESEYPKDNLEKKIEQLEKEKANRKRSATSAPVAKQQQQQNGSKRTRTTTSVGPAAAPMNVVGPNPTISTFQQSRLLPEYRVPYLSSAAGPYGLVGTTPATHYAASSAGPYGLVGTTPATHYAASSAGPYGLVGPTPDAASSGGSYGLVGPTPGAVPYVASSAGPYSLVGPTPRAAPYAASSTGLYVGRGLSGNPSPAEPQLYSSNPSLGSQLYSSDPHTISSYSDRPTSYAAYGMPSPQYHTSYYPQ